MRIPKGAVILEALVVVGIAAAYLGGLVTLAIAANSSSDRAEEITRAVWNMNEGLAALQTIAFADLTTTETGSLTFASGRWTLGTSGPQALPDGMTRTVRVQTVQRDAGCLVVASGGTVDDDSRMLVSDVTWTDVAGRSHTVTSRALRTRWDDPQGSCFGATMATSVTWAVEGAEWSGGKQLRDLWFTNTGGNAATVNTIAFTWTNGATMSQLFMDTTKVWSSSGPGTPLHNLTSGEQMDIQDFTVPPGGTGEVNKGQFDINMEDTCLTMTVTFTDASSWTSPEFCPD